VEEGVNVTLTLQVALTASDAGQVLAEIANMAAFAPVRVMLDMVSAVVPLFVTTTDSGELVLDTVVFGKGRDVGLKLIPALPVPVPFTVALWGLPGALSVNMIADARFPVLDGVNTTDTVHVPPFAGTSAQPEGVGAKSPALAP
jgi:hypothetical protein